MHLRAEPRPQRLIPRYPLEQIVRVRTNSGAARSYQARDVSQGGLFLTTDDTFDLFGELEVEVELPSSRRATLHARVVHVLSSQTAKRRGVQCGIGLQFEGLNETERACVDELVAGARAEDTRLRVPKRLALHVTTSVPSDPMLNYLLEHIDGQRDPEALAERMALDVTTIERMLDELQQRRLIELKAANPNAAEAARPIITERRPIAGKRHGGGERAERASAQAPSEDERTFEARLGALEARIAGATHYELLEVDDHASVEHIRGRYRALSAPLEHVERERESPRCQRVLAALREAYSVLSSAPKRAEYDEYLARARQLAAAESQRAAWAAPPSAASAARATELARAQAAAAALRDPSARRGASPQPAPVGAATRLFDRAELAYRAGKLDEAARHLNLLAALTFEDSDLDARVGVLQSKVAAGRSVTFEKQAAYEEKRQHWELALQSWLRVSAGRPNDSAPLQRAALAGLQAKTDLRQVMDLAKRAVELANDDPKPRRVLARVYFAAGMSANARRELEVAQRLEQPAEDAGKKPPNGLLRRLLGP